MKSSINKIILLLFIPTIMLGVSLPAREVVHARPKSSITTPSQLIEAVNSLRSTYGLAPLVMHSILMQTAQSQADYMAAIGYATHTRPGGVTFTQQLISLGFPLAGDLSLGGFRSENVLNTYGPLEWNGVPSGWQDSQHMNTMLSGNFSNIGAGVSQSGDSYYYAVDTAAVTGSGQQQTSASSILTSVPSGANEAAGVSQYMVPVTISTAGPDGNVFHKVQYGQSLWSIAIAYGTTIKNIQALNNLGEGATVYQGQELLVLTGATQPAAQATEVIPTTTVTSAPVNTATLSPTMTSVTLVTESPTETEQETTPSKPVSSRILIVVLIVAAFIGAGMAVWLIRDPNG